MTFPFKAMMRAPGALWRRFVAFLARLLHRKPLEGFGRHYYTVQHAFKPVDPNGTVAVLFVLQGGTSCRYCHAPIRMADDSASLTRCNACADRIRDLDQHNPQTT